MQLHCWHYVSFIENAVFLQNHVSCDMLVPATLYTLPCVHLTRVHALTLCQHKQCGVEDNNKKKKKKIFAGDFMLTLSYASRQLYYIFYCTNQIRRENTVKYRDKHAVNINLQISDNNNDNEQTNQKQLINVWLLDR